MKENLKTLINSQLFRGVEEQDLENMLKCLVATEKYYEKNETIVMAGTKLSSVGIVISGKAQITREDAEGNRTILSDLGKADLFGEAYAAAGEREVPISVVAVTDCKVVWIPFSKVVIRCSFSCSFHRVLIENMMRLIAEKNIAMNEKMRILSCKTTREKLLTYLMDFSEELGKKKFKIPFGRGELADFLSVDRSAMSRELSKLKNEGILSFQKNEFEIK